MLHSKDIIWMLGIDMDEYPYSSKDMTEGFLYRYLVKVTDARKTITGR